MSEVTEVNILKAMENLKIKYGKGILEMSDKELYMVLGEELERIEKT